MYEKLQDKLILLLYNSLSKFFNNTNFVNVDMLRHVDILWKFMKIKEKLQILYSKFSINLYGFHYSL